MKKQEYRAISFLCELPMARDGTTMIRTPEDAWTECREIRDLGNEIFLVLSLNTRNRMLDKRMVSTGIMDSTLVHPREVFRKAITDGAAAILLVHNHPSGDPTPSAEDVSLTRQMISTGKIIGIKVLDHVIIGRKSGDYHRDCLSLRESGTCEFD